MKKLILASMLIGSSAFSLGLESAGKAVGSVVDAVGNAANTKLVLVLK